MQDTPLGKKEALNQKKYEKMNSLEDFAWVSFCGKTIPSNKELTLEDIKEIAYDISEQDVNYILKILPTLDSDQRNVILKKLIELKEKEL